MAVSVDVRDRGHDGSFLGPNRVDLQHEGIGHGTNKVLVERGLVHRRGKRTEALSELDAGVDDFPHVRAPGVRDDAAVAERARTPLHPSLEPSDDAPVSELCGRPRVEIGQHLRGAALHEHAGGLFLIEGVGADEATEQRAVIQRRQIGAGEGSAPFGGDAPDAPV